MCKKQTCCSQFVVKKNRILTIQILLDKDTFTINRNMDGHLGDESMLVPLAIKELLVCIVLTFSTLFASRKITADCI